MTLVITKDNFEDEVLRSDLPVLVDFWAPWCGPCKTVGPIIEELADELAGVVKVGKLNVEEQRKLAIQYKVMSIPTFALFKNGKIETQISGAMGKKELKQALKL